MEFLVILFVIFIVLIILLAVLFRRRIFSGSAEPICEESECIGKFVPHFKELTNMIKSELIYKIRDKNKKKYSKNREKQRFFKYMLNKLDFNQNYDEFLDICACPGDLSLELLKIQPKSHGYGISLYPSKGGYKPSESLKSHARYKLTYYDLLTDEFDPFPNLKVDLVCIGCFVGHNVVPDTTRLYANAFKLACNKLKKGGSLIWTLPYRWSGDILFNGIELITQHFQQIKIISDTKITPGLAIAYILAENFTGIEDKKLIQNYINGKIFTEKTLEKCGKQVDTLLSDLIMYYKSNQNE